MKLIWIVVVGSASVIGTASANDSVYAGCSGAMSGMSSAADCVPTAHSAIALVDEKLDIAARDKSAAIVATYTFENTGPATTVIVGFPVQGPFEPDGPSDGGGRVPPLIDYAVALDTKPLEYKVFFPNPDGSAAARKAATTYEYDAVYLIEVPFEAGQRRVLEHRYSTGQTLIGYAYSSVRYILRTGANWKGGTIGKIAITVRLVDPITPACLRTSLPGTKFDVATRTFSFTATSWKPKEDLVVSFVPAEFRAQMLFGTQESLPESKAIEGLSNGELETVLGGVQIATVLDIYTGLLASYSAAKLPRSMKGDEALCNTELRKVKVAWKPDPKVTLASFPKWAQAFLLGADAHLRKAKVRHPALP